MFKPSEIIIDAYVEELDDRFLRVVPDAPDGHRHALRRAARLLLTHVARTNALYTNLEVTLLVADVACEIVEGRQLERYDVSADDWLHFVVAAMSIFVGYVRGTLPNDQGRHCMVATDGETLELQRHQTDGCLFLYATDRAKIFVRHQFRPDPTIDGARVADAVEFTRLPAPQDPDPRRDQYGPLLRAAQIIAFGADPRLKQRVKRYYRQLEEAGVAGALGYRDAEEVMDMYPKRFWDHLLPHMETALNFLKYTASGQVWLARLNAHMLEEEHRS